MSTPTSILHRRASDDHERPAISSVLRIAAHAMVTVKLGGTIFFTLFATMVVLVSEKTPVDLGVSNQLLTVLGLVLGFVITFRTSSAYERYQDGRKMWTNIIVASRSLAHQIWVHVQEDAPRKNPQTTSPMPEEVREEKLRMIKLIQAFSVSVKHLLRGEESVYYEDLWPLVHFLPMFVPGTTDEMRMWHVREKRPSPRSSHAPSEDSESKISTEHNYTHIPSHPSAEPRIASPKETKREDSYKSSKSVQSSRILSSEARLGRTGTYRSEKIHEKDMPPCKWELKPARSPPSISVFDYFSSLKYLRFAWRVVTGSSHPERNNAKARRRRNYTEIVTVHVPMEISLILSNYVNFLINNKLVDGTIASHIADNLFLLQDTVSNLERICNTPLPFAYQAHLKISLWLYLLVLPFQIYPTYRYVAIPATAFAAFLMLGFVDIAEEIENPFDYDFNDLDLDHFCSIVKRDIHEITMYKPLDDNKLMIFGGLWQSYEHTLGGRV